jgi:hypothetical protein
VDYYQKSVSLRGGSAILKTQLAAAQIASEDDNKLSAAIDNLRQSLNSEPDNGFVFFQKYFLVRVHYLCGSGNHYRFSDR